MSHFSSVKVDFKQSQQDCLIEALQEIFGENAVEVSEHGLALYGYHGDDRSKLAKSNPNYAPLCQIKIGRKHVGQASNDVGFAKNEDGTYNAYISEYDNSSNFNKAKQDKLKQLYTCNVTKKTLKAKGYSVKVTKDKGGLLKISASKFSK
jgi:hypothetical protein